MVNAFAFFVAALAAGSVAALPVQNRDFLSSLLNSPPPPPDDSAGGTGIPVGFGSANQQAAHDAQASQEATAATAAAAAESAAGIDIVASIAAASSSAAAAAATATVNPNDPFPPERTTLTPEQIGQLSGLRAKLAIDTQFGDTGAIIQDNDDIEALISSGEATF
ncbi:hypothetical protein B0H17DRAFT_1134717 [Mycena rosella]|uniref:Uncharacterized protein n=1 Tax=Mycena rosella TaxID=1033263 RepID=A0AAD7DF85_MYCRO|nr:hypothetical protein B0H17DRAFT_1134717 [Mycena rosella]